METVKLYYENARTAEFSARVLSCEPRRNGGFAVVLDRTAFNPEGGGQTADTGALGDVRVTDAHEREGIIYHYTDGPLTPGTEVTGRLDWAERWRKMQNHSGEHIVSGLVHARYGYDNVGFHLGEEGCTIDFSGELTRTQLDEIEDAANAVVWQDLPVVARFPGPEELRTLEYRSKLDLTENVRIVTIEGVDVCACCAPHVARTGEIGVIKLLDAMRHRGGVRITALCGMDAAELADRQQESVTAISGLLSVKREQVVPGVERLLENLARQKERIAVLGLELARLRAESLPETEGNLTVFDAVLDEAALREMVNRLMEKCAVAASFSGSDGEGYRYIIGSRHIDLRAEAKAINAALRGKGGGKPTMIQGSCEAKKDEIEAYFQA